MTVPESDESLTPPRPVKSSRGRMLDRVRAALRGEFDADKLEPDEERLFEDMLIDYYMQPNPESEAFAAMMRAEDAYVGEDECGRLVRTLPGGGVEVIHESIDAVDRWRMELVAHRREVSRVLVAAQTLVGGDRNLAISWFESEHLRTSTANPTMQSCARAKLRTSSITLRPSLGAHPDNSSRLCQLLGFAL